MKLRTKLILAISGLTGFIWLHNTALLAARQPGQPTVLAHRGLSQEYDRTGLTRETCTAARMLPPRHDYLENTIGSIAAAFEAGAQVVELDVQPTTDGKFAVFHDWRLECRTNGSGRTRDHTMAELRALDVGFGYTPDAGQTFPFRGKGVGMMPSLGEVLERFPDRAFHIDVKSDDPAEGESLARFLAMLTPPHRERLTVIGGERPVEALLRELPQMRTATKASVTRCISRYAGVGWSGYVPEECRNTALFVPVNIAPWLWGWPNKFLDRMESVGTRVFVMGPYEGSGFSDGLDDPGLLARLPEGYDGGISTDAADLILPALESRRQEASAASLPAVSN